MKNKSIQTYIAKLDKRYPGIEVSKKKSLDKKITSITKRYPTLSVKRVAFFVLALFGLYIIHGRMIRKKPLKLSDITRSIDRDIRNNPPPPPPPPSLPPPQSPRPIIPSELVKVTKELYKAIGWWGAGMANLDTVRTCLAKIKSYETKNTGQNPIDEYIFVNIFKMVMSAPSLYLRTPDADAGTSKIAVLLLKYMTHLQTKHRLMPVPEFLQHYAKSHNENLERFKQKVVDNFKTQASSVIQKKYKERYARRKKNAADVIKRHVLHHMYKPDGVMAKKIVAGLYAQTAKEVQNTIVPRKKSGKKVGWKETTEIRTIPVQARRRYKPSVPSDIDENWNANRFDAQNQPTGVLKNVSGIPGERRKKSIANINGLVTKRRETRNKNTRTQEQVNMNRNIIPRVFMRSRRGETPKEEMNRNIQMGIVRPKTGSLKNIRFETEEEANAWGNQYRQSLENLNRELSTA